MGEGRCQCGRSDFCLNKLICTNCDSASVKFFQQIEQELNEALPQKILIGDFNLVMDNALDRMDTFTNNCKAAEVVRNIKEQYMLEDVWRI